MISNKNLKVNTIRNRILKIFVTPDNTKYHFKIEPYSIGYIKFTPWIKNMTLDVLYRQKFLFLALNILYCNQDVE